MAANEIGNMKFIETTIDKLKYLSILKTNSKP